MCAAAWATELNVPMWMYFCNPICETMHFLLRPKKKRIILHTLAHVTQTRSHFSDVYLFGITRLSQNCLIMRKKPHAHTQSTLSQAGTKMTFAYANVNLPLVCQKCVYFALTVTLHCPNYYYYYCHRCHVSTFLNRKYFLLLSLCVRQAWGPLMERRGEAHLKWHLMLKNSFTPHPLIRPILA